VDLSRSGRVIPAELSEMSYVNFKEEFENTLRRLCDVAPEKIPVTLKGEEFRPANRNVPSRKYGGKGTAQVVAFVGENPSKNILLVGN
jgi:hypothetical protein